MKNNDFINELINRALEKDSTIILPEISDKRIQDATLKLRDLGFNIVDIDSFSNNDKPNIHRFSNTDKVSILYEYIEQEFNQSIFDIIQTYPRKSLKDDKMKTLLSMNLDKSTIIVQYK